MLKIEKELRVIIAEQQKEIERLNKISEEYKEKYQDVYEGFCSYEQALKGIKDKIWIEDIYNIVNKVLKGDQK